MTMPPIERDIKDRAKNLVAVDRDRRKILTGLEDTLAKAHDKGYTVSALARISGLRRERAHYAIQRSKARRNDRGTGS